jgi:hypothetical protein
VNKRKKDTRAESTEGTFYASEGEERLAITLMLILGLLIAMFTFHPQKASAESITSKLPDTLTYSCSIPSHCYGANTWLGPTIGSFTVIDAVNLASGDGSIDNEMWLVDNNLNGSKQCIIAPGDSNFKCWVEAGYVHFSGDSQRWFWADLRPQGGGCYQHCYYIEHDEGILNSGDYNNVVDVTLVANGTAGQWSVQVLGHVTGFNATSVDNAMSPNRIDIGQELEGSQGANAPHANFQDNEWYNGAGPHYQTVDGILDYAGDPNNPPWAGWNQNQRPSNSPYGGVWYTCSLPSNGGNPC